MHYALMRAADTNDTGDYSYTGIKDTTLENMGLGTSSMVGKLR